MILWRRGVNFAQATLIFSNPVLETIRLVRFWKYEHYCLLDNFSKNHAFMAHRRVRFILGLETEICATFEWWLGDDSRARLSERVKPHSRNFRNDGRSDFFTYFPQKKPLKFLRFIFHFRWSTDAYLQILRILETFSRLFTQNETQAKRFRHQF